MILAGGLREKRKGAGVSLTLRQYLDIFPDFTLGPPSYGDLYCV